MQISLLPSPALSLEHYAGFCLIWMSRALSLRPPSSENVPQSSERTEGNSLQRDETEMQLGNEEEEEEEG